VPPGLDSVTGGDPVVDKAHRHAVDRLPRPTIGGALILSEAQEDRCYLICTSPAPIMNWGTQRTSSARSSTGAHGNIHDPSPRADSVEGTTPLPKRMLMKDRLLSHFVFWEEAAA
jgi:hypothetical protein